MKVLHTRIMLILVLLTPPSFIGVLYLMVRRNESIGEAKWEGINPATLAMPDDTAQNLELGAKVYRQHCALCHGENREGGAGKALNLPHLAGEPGFHYAVITIVNGVPGTTMTPWRRSLAPTETAAVAAWISRQPTAEMPK